MKRILAIVSRFLVLVIVYAVCFSVIAAILLPRPQQEVSGAENAAMLTALLLVSFLNSAVIAYVVSRSRWSGWKLALTLWFVLFGVITFMGQIETAVFIRNFPPGLLTRLFLVGLVFSAVFAPLAVLILGKRRADYTSNEDDSRPRLSVAQWIPKLILIAVVYVTLYFTFGYFIAWKSPAVRAYYGGTDPGSFGPQMLSVWRESPWLVPLQILRAMLWTALAVPILRMMSGHWWEPGLAVALMFSVVMNSQLLLPNPLMPQEVRMMHLLETASSNFLFGWILSWLLRPRHLPTQPRRVHAQS